MRKIVIALVAAVAVVLPANAGAAQLKGVVVAKQKASHTLVVAARNGTSWSVRTKARARVGSIVTVAATRLQDGTYAATSVHVSGRTSHAKVRGVVVRNRAGATFFAVGRSVLAVRSRSRSLLSAASAGPKPGTVADVGVAIGQNGGLTATSITTVGQSDQVVVQAIVLAVTPATATTSGSLTLDVNGQALVIPLPAGTTLPPNVVVGTTVMVTIRLSPTGPVGGALDPDDTDDSDDSDDSDDTDDSDDSDDDD